MTNGNQKHPILPEPTLRRLPWYLSYVDTISARGVENVSSTTISRALNVDASQIAKDLSFLNIKGKTRIGYNVRTLQSELSKFLDFHTPHTAYLFGVGNLGRALLQDKGLINYGLKIHAAFDVDPNLTDTEICGVKVHDLTELSHIMNEDPAAVAILTVPAENAQDVADFAMKAGVKAIWNFTPYRVKVPPEVVLSSTSMYANLAIIYNRLKA
ncbi:MAG: redox-sensing transcriptional repressor Rex [Muribaculum sp.]|nr:redox-sensing transcriptional repressor Rex [Muribaculum sp.]